MVGIVDGWKLPISWGAGTRGEMATWMHLELGNKRGGGCRAELLI